jgi:predicted amino acid racemase
VLAVTKGLRGDRRAAEAFLLGGAAGLADSRLSNLRGLQHLREGGPAGRTTPFLLLRAPTPAKAGEAAALSDRVLCTDPATAESLARAAEPGRSYEIHLPVDFGDLREGLLPEDLPEAAVTLEKRLIQVTGEKDPSRRAHIAGLASNMACFCGVVPTRDHLERLSEMAARAGERLGRRLRVSAGNTATLPLLLAGRLPEGLDEVRVGEGIILGRESLHREPLPGCHLDAVTFSASVIETGVKPSAPSGELAEDAFGHRPAFVDRGRRLRAIIAAGRQDIVPEGLKPLEEGIEVVGGTSDHLILDIEEYPGHLEVGHEVTFSVNYACLLQAMTSPDVARVYLETDREF